MDGLSVVLGLFLDGREVVFKLLLDNLYVV